MNNSKNISSEELLDEFVRRVELGAIKVSSRYLYDTEECEIRFFTDYKIIGWLWLNKRKKRKEKKYDKELGFLNDKMKNRTSRSG